MTPDIIGLIILVGCIILFLTNWIPSAATAVLGCFLMALTGISKFSSVFSGFSNSIVVLVFGLLVVGMGMQKSGLAYTIGKIILRFAKNERVFVVIASVIAGGLSMFLSNTAVIAMFLSIMNSVVQASDNMKLKHICLPVSMSAMFGGVCTLVGSTPQLMVQSIMEEYVGEGYSMFDYMPVGLILFAVFIVYYLLYGYKLAHKLWKEDDTDHEKLKAFTDKHDMIQEGTIKDQIIVGIIIVIMIVLFITEWISNVMTSLLCCFLLIIFRQVKEKDIVSEMDWVVLIRLAGCLGIAAGLADCEAGELIANGFIGIFGENISQTMLLTCAVVLTMVISNFITNSTAIFIVLPSVISIALKLGYNPMIFGIATCYAGNLCFATPLANAQTGITMVAGYEFKDYPKYNLLLEVLVAAVIIIFVPLFF